MRGSVCKVAILGIATVLFTVGCASNSAILTPEQESAAQAEAAAANSQMGADGITFAPTEPGKYEQTWTRGYDVTTCTEWSKKMDDHQRWVAAADMLTNARGVWKIGTMPSDSLIDTFEADIDMNCDTEFGSSQAISDIATMLVMIGGQEQYGG